MSVLEMSGSEFLSQDSPLAAELDERKAKMLRLSGELRCLLIARRVLAPGRVLAAIMIRKVSLNILAFAYKTLQ